MWSSSDLKSWLKGGLQVLYPGAHRVQALHHAGEKEAQVFVTFRGVVPLGDIWHWKPEDVGDVLAKALLVELVTAEEVCRRREEFERAVEAACEKRNPSRRRGPGRPLGSKNKRVRKRVGVVA